ncbi:Spy0128 family protein [Olsenella sp. Marseille-P4559]|uniref:Spy0128 family protein n=1 Tax=Olsenella sp. Marseille-P4559 TaxID=2364795 RepID=UPI00102F3263|nr:FctA domain-containing protein [Olsenella sp. Marseille-P4559]
MGANTTKTPKMPTVQLGATKTVDGQAPGSGQAFAFQLCDGQGEVLQEKQNDGGTVPFDKLVYSEDGLAADGSDSTMRYAAGEKAGDSPSYAYDDTVYDVAVTLHRETAPHGRTTVTATPAITKAGPRSPRWRSTTSRAPRRSLSPRGGSAPRAAPSPSACWPTGWTPARR